MEEKFRTLPVYEQKERILEVLENNQVIVVQSPTGSGKTTQLPIILYEAGFCNSGMIGVTQPRRIATLSVSEFISRQMGTTFPGLVGYKMRFEDKTNALTKIKILTDGMLLQELKLDPFLSKYSIIMVDEAHERSLNIDFTIGLLKRILKARPEFKVIISSATINAELFSKYFFNCPIVTIETETYPITLIYDPPETCGTLATPAAQNSLQKKLKEIVCRILDNNTKGDILIFLPGEKIIKDTISSLCQGRLGRKLHILPLYARLSREQQNRVFETAPFGKKKVVVATNIAETSITIDGITSVIDCGLAKINFYNPGTYTSSLVEIPVSKASCNQRKGRAGRTQSGTCYRLYRRKDFEFRPMYTTEEILRTDLSEVILQMSDLGINDFENFDFISPPEKAGIRSAVETLNMLGALESDMTLSKIGKMMVNFPIGPRESRIIVEAIIHYPSVIEETLIAASFLSSQSPFLLPQGEETDARKAQQEFADSQGDFISYLRLFRQFTASTHKEKFCKHFYLDLRIMEEIANVKSQLEQIICDMGIPVLSSNNTEDYLCCIATGLIQFVCVSDKKDFYKSIRADKIQIHPSSVMFRKNAQFIVAGEIVKTSRIFAMSVSPISKKILNRVNPLLESWLMASSKTERKKDEKVIVKIENDEVRIGDKTFQITKIKGKKHLILPLNSFVPICKKLSDTELAETVRKISGLRGVITGNFNGKSLELFKGEKCELIFKAATILDLKPIVKNEKIMKKNFSFKTDFDEIIKNLDIILKLTLSGKRKGDLYFVAMCFADDFVSRTDGIFYFKLIKNFSVAINESIASIEKLISLMPKNADNSVKNKINGLYRKLSEFYNF